LRRSRSGDAFLLLFVVLALLFSLLYSIAEAALLKKLRRDNIDQSLAAILTVNTIAHTAVAIGAGAKATAVFGDAWFGGFSAIMPRLVVVGE